MKWSRLKMGCDRLLVLVLLTLVAHLEVAHCNAQLLFGGAGGLLDTSLFELGPGSGDLGFDLENEKDSKSGQSPFFLSPFLQDLRSSLTSQQKAGKSHLGSFWFRTV